MGVRRLQDRYNIVAMTQHQLRKPEEMSPEELSLALKNAHVLEAWISAIKNHAFETLKAGNKIPGFKLGFGSKKRIWSFGKIEPAMEAFMKLGIPRDELFTKPVFLSPPQIEKLFKEKNMWPSKKRGEDRPVTPIDPFYEMSMPEPRVVPMEDGDEITDRATEAAREFG